MALLPTVPGIRDDLAAPGDQAQRQALHRHLRQACHIRLRSAVYHWALVAIQRYKLSGRGYAELRKRGRSHGRALRSVADRLFALTCATLTRQVPFDPQYFAMRATA